MSDQKYLDRYITKKMEMSGVHENRSMSMNATVGLLALGFVGTGVAFFSVLALLRHVS